MKERHLLLQKLGSWSFIFGFIISIISGFFELTPGILSVLVFLGVIVGFLNVTGKKAMTFLMATASMVVISSLGSPAFSGIAVFGAILQKMLNNLIIFVIPASMIVALRAVLTIAYKK